MRPAGSSSGGGDPRHRTNLAELTVQRGEDGLYCTTPDGRSRFRPIDVLGMILAADVLDAFRLPGGDRAHLPRIWVDDLVITRESWTVPLAEFELPRHPATELAGFQMIRRIAARLGLPRFVFLKLPGELKPFYIDLTSSAQAAALVSAIRRARETEEPDRRGALHRDASGAGPGVAARAGRRAVHERTEATGRGSGYCLVIVTNRTPP